MIIPVTPENEIERVRSLKEYSILDTLPEQEFEDMTKIASEICQTPISLITLVDTNKQWFKSNRGLNVRETERHYAFCAHAINTPDRILVVKDSREDVRFVDNPLATGYPNVIFYAGVPLINADGFALGTICVIDNTPRELSQQQLDSLRALANQVVQLFERKRLNEVLKESQKQLRERNAELEQFACLLSHDIKSPLNNIMALTSILQNDPSRNETESNEKIIDHIANSSLQLKSLIDGIIAHYIGINAVIKTKDEIQIYALFEDIIDLLDSRREHEITYTSELSSIKVNEVAIKQILTNLLSNSIKYNRNEKVKIAVKILDRATFIAFVIEDNGIGIDKSKYSKIFDTFATLKIKDRFNKVGTGIGLSTVKKLVEKLGGTITIESEIGLGSKFIFHIKK